MFPSKSIYDKANSGVADAELLCDGGLFCARCGQRSDLQYLVGGQFRHRVAFALGGSPLGLSILHVRCRVALKKMRRVATWSPITLVANKDLGPASVSQVERDAMREVATLLRAEHSVTSIDDTPSPPPTITSRALTGSLINVCPKALDFLRGKFGRVYSKLSHISLLSRSVWLGSFECLAHSFGPFYCTTRSV